jgi:hypothetical protein
VQGGMTCDFCVELVCCRRAARNDQTHLSRRYGTVMHAASGLALRAWCFFSSRAAVVAVWALHRLLLGVPCVVAVGRGTALGHGPRRDRVWEVRPRRARDPSRGAGCETHSQPHQHGLGVFRGGPRHGTAVFHVCSEERATAARHSPLQKARRVLRHGREGSSRLRTCPLARLFACGALREPHLCCELGACVVRRSDLAGFAHVFRSCAHVRAGTHGIGVARVLDRLTCRCRKSPCGNSSRASCWESESQAGLAVLAQSCSRLLGSRAHDAGGATAVHSASKLFIACCRWTPDAGASFAARTRDFVSQFTVATTFGLEAKRQGIGASATTKTQSSSAQQLCTCA